MHFVHLNMMTEYSITESIIRIPNVVAAAVKDQMPALAITDLSNLHATIKFYNACMKKGIKPIIGCQIRLEDSEHRITLLAMNQQGFKNLTELVSRGYSQGQHLDIPCIQQEWIFEQHEGLITLHGLHSPLGEMLVSNNPTKAEPLLQQWIDVFGNRFYFALSRTQRANEENFIQQAVHYADQHRVGVVAVNDVHFLTADDFDVHEARVCIADGYILSDERRPRKYSSEQYFKTQQEMCQLFADLPSAIENTFYIAQRCSVELQLGTYFLPDYPIPDGFTIDSFFHHRSKQGLEERLDFLYPVAQRGDDWQDIRKPYDERLEYEVKIILQMGFPGYFLIVMDFIQWAKNNGVPVGPGRGSGAGSLVAYSLGITDLDPLRYELLFERFLNPERVSMPDFDVDFCIAGRDKVINYVAENYGREAVSQIATFGTMAAKGVIKDVARVLGKSYGLSDRMTKLIPAMGYDLHICLNGKIDAKDEKNSLAPIPELIDLVSNPANPDYDDASEIWEMAVKLEGLTRNTGKHAGGVVIAPGKITDFSAISCDADGTNRVSQYDKDDVESAGLVKFDFLGLRNLTVINEALATINQNLPKEQHIDISRIALDDPKAFKIFAEGNTTAVFQFESTGMKRMIKEAKPSQFEELIAFVSLYRPGPMDNIPDFIARMHGQEFTYLHPLLENTLKPTYGIMVYQEQVMQAAQICAGYTLGGADLLRRAMGKKKPEEMAKQRDIFIAGAAEKGIDIDQANFIFDNMEEFAGYGFNKSHAAAYALVAYQTAWLKAYYPSQFMSAVLSSEMTNTDTVVFLIDDCRSLGLTILPPSVNHSSYRFTAQDAQTIVYGLGAIKGVGESAMESVLEARQRDGNFKDLFDFCHRVDMKKINKRTLEALIRAGAFDCFGEERSALMEQLPEAVQAAEQARSNRETGIMDLFGEVEEVQRKPTRPIKAWSDAVRLQGEKETLGLYLTGHPMDMYNAELKHVIKQSFKQLTPTERGKFALFAGLVIDIANFPNRVVIRLDDGTARIDVNCYHEVFQRVKHQLHIDQLILIEGSLQEREGMDLPVGRLKRVFSIDEVRQKRAKEIHIHITHQALHTQLAQDLKNIIQPFCQAPADQKRVPLIFHFDFDYATANMTIANQWQVVPCEALMEKLRAYFGQKALTMSYQEKQQSYAVEHNYLAPQFAPQATQQMINPHVDIDQQLQDAQRFSQQDVALSDADLTAMYGTP
ncbi:MAG: DNA polymerase III subunit alpha [Acinetobacter sp.]|nr:DNA polymerase III subunit alpha [Acinetobacter sp.]